MQSTTPPSYAPAQVQQKTQGLLTVLQLTDLHLRLSDFQDGHLYRQHGHSFKCCLQQALSENKSVDLIIITGDIIHEMSSEIYDCLFAEIAKTGIPFVCISGNHDVTDEVGTDDMLFEDYDLVAYPADKRLVNCHSIESEHWQLLFVDSSVPGKISGYLSQERLQWLEQQLINNKKPAVLCLHHHIEPINSKWIDQHILLNASDLWQIISRFPHFKAVVHGHIHQEYHVFRKHLQVFATPATCYQFKPNSDEFALDELSPGYRWFSLFDDGSIESSIRRLT